MAQKRILVADDDESVRGMLGRVLRQRGLEVDVASDGAEALGLLDAHTYSVILLDLLMPGVDGFGVLRALQGLENHALPIVLVVTGADRAVVERVDTRIVHGVIRKPFDPHDVATIVAACTEVRSRNALEAMALAMMSGAWVIEALKRLGV